MSPVTSTKVLAISHSEAVVDSPINLRRKPMMVKVDKVSDTEETNEQKV